MTRLGSTVPGATWAPLVTAGGVGHTWRVWVTGNGLVDHELAVSDVALSFDETRAPLIQATISAAVPSIDVLRLVDPRGADVRVRLEFGYAAGLYGPGATDTIELLLLARRIELPGDVLTLEAVSHEAVLLDAALLVPSATYPATWSTSSTIGLLVSNAAPSVYYSNFVLAPAWAGGGDGSPAIGTELQVAAGRPVWPVLSELAERADLWLYSPGFGLLDLIPRPAPRPQDVPAYTLAVGPTGTVTELTTSTSRLDWASTVLVRHTWRDAAGVDQTVIGYYRDPDPAIVSHRTVVIERDTPSNEPLARSAATAIQQRMTARGRATHTITAPAAFWLRPGSLVLLELPTAQAEPGRAGNNGPRAVVGSITFRASDGSMTVTTRAVS